MIFSYQAKNVKTRNGRGWSKQILNKCFKGTQWFICEIA